MSMEKVEKVKIFSRAADENDFEKLEEDVNQWLSKDEDIEIVSRQVVGSAGVNILQKAFVNCTIVIFYQTKS